MFKSLRRSKLSLVRDLQVKVNAINKSYYFNEKAYCSSSDGFIDLIEIPEEVYNMSVLLKMKHIEVDLKDAQQHIKREIETIRGNKNEK